MQEAQGDMEPELVREEPPAAKAPNPFLPGTKIRYAWDATCLEAFKRCPRLYYYQYVEGWSPKGENVHIRFGSELHTALEDYDRLLTKGASKSDALRQIVKELLIRSADFVTDDKYKNRNFLVRAVIWYLDKYEDDPAETVVLGNGKPAVELSFRFELDYGPAIARTWNSKDGVEPEGFGPEFQPYVFCGHLDRVVNFQDFPFVMDRKTTKTTPGSYYFDNFSPNTQMTLYTIAGQIVFDIPVKGVIIDVIHTAIEFTRAVRGLTYRTNDYLDEWLNEQRFWLEQAERCAVEDHWPHNDTACSMYGGCKFRGVCSKSPSVRHIYLNSDFVQAPEEERWNPLKTR